MPKTNPNLIFGIHSITPYDRSTRKPISYLRVVGEATLNLTGEFEELKGGSNMYAWDAEPSGITSEFSLTAREYDNDMMTMLLAGVKTEYDSENNGEIVDAENINGDSVYTSTGIASVTITTAADVKEGEYVVIANSATKVDIYAMSDVDFARGTSLDINDANLIASDITITQSSDVAIPGLGVTLTGGSGTIVMKANDSMRFRIRRPLVKGVKIVVGSAASSFSEFGCIISGQKKSDGSLTFLDIYRCKAAGMPISFKEKGYSEWQLTVKILYDSDKDGIFEYLTSK